MDIKSLSDYGHTFQIKLISSLLSDQTFTQRIIDIIEPEYFQSEANSTIIQIIKDYYIKYKHGPTLDALKVDVVAIKDEVLKVSIIENLKEAYKNLSSSDLQQVKDHSLKFCKNQITRNAILESVTKLEEGDYDGIKVLIDDALRAGVEPSLGLDYIKEVDRRYSETSRVCIPTRWPVINEIMNGGLAQNELGVIIGGPGGGKCIGPNTNIEIQFEEFAIPSKLGDIWISPFDKIKMGDGIELFGWEARIILENS